jgi:putative peptide zinc metalloprotease protein
MLRPNRWAGRPCHAMNSMRETILPPLREELVIHESTRGHDGQPGWGLHDPARNRFFRLDWLSFEILQRWSLGVPAVIARNVGEQTPLRPSESDVESVLTFLSQNQLLHLAGGNTSATFAREVRERRQTGWRWVLHNYLFFRVPLVQPESLLRWLDARLRLLYSPLFWWITAGALLAGVVLVSRQWETFSATWGNLRDASGLLGLVVVVLLVKVVHEFGHGLVATHFGCRVPTMGVAFLVMTPVAYTDVNEAWKLTDRSSRLWIGAAGVLAELCLAAWATLAWAVLPDGAWRNAAFILAAVTWVKSVLINASPIMRFDGYYLLSDYLELPNLHQRAFALARWQLRELLFRLGAQPPEHFRPALRRGLVSFAWFVWIYRLVLFLGIAVFVYHTFFKALGIVLFAVEIVWFVLLPVWSELTAWYKERRSIRRSRRWIGVAGGTVTLLALTAIPIPQRVRVVGVLSPQQEFKVVTPAPAQLLELSGLDGVEVQPGDILFRLASPELDQKLARAIERERTLRAEVAAAGVDATQRPRLLTLQAALATAQAARRDAELTRAQLTPTAPFAGVLRLRDCELRPGEWLARDEHMATLVAPGPLQATGFLTEQAAHLVSEGAQARFYPENAPEQTVAMVVRAVERDATRTLSHPMLTTPFGGKLPAHLVEGELVPEQAVYRVSFDAAELDSVATNQVRRGTLVIAAGRESLLARWSRNFVSLLWREAGF